MAREEVRAIELLRDTPYGRVGMSRHAMPFVTIARHIVVDSAVLLRVHRGFGYHSACDGNVVAYEADNLAESRQDVWSVQFVGMARSIAEPTPEELERFGPAAAAADGEPFEPAYLRIDPEFVTVHWLTGVPNRQ